MPSRRPMRLECSRSIKYCNPSGSSDSGNTLPLPGRRLSVPAVRHARSENDRLRLDGDHGGRYNTLHDRVVSRPRHRRRLRRQELTGSEELLPPLLVGGCPTQAGPDPSCSRRGRACHPAGESSGTPSRRKRGSIQQPNQRAVQDLFQMGEGSCPRSRNRRLPLIRT